MKKYLLLAVAAAILVGIFLFYQFAKKNGVAEKIIEHQNQQIEIYEDTIEVKNFQQKIINKTVVNADATSRRKFLQLVFTERNNPDT